MSDEPPYLVQLGEVQTGVVKPLFESLPPSGWQSATVEYRKAGPVAESRVTVHEDAGRSVVIDSPMEMVRALKRLREFMATQGKGAWLSVDLKVTSAGKCSFDYNYNERPNWTAQPSDESYIEDLQKYPRAVDQIPEWYPRSPSV